MLRAALLALLAFAHAAWADPPRHGLIENRTGLPLTLPLQVRTDPGRDYYMILRDESGARALSAFIEGGRFFQLMMPPGEYTAHFAAGAAWRNETDLFGAGTLLYDYPEPLSFSVKGLWTRQGVRLDLRGLFSEEARASAVPFALCQVARRVPAPPPPQSDTDDPPAIHAEAPPAAANVPGPRDPLLDGAPELVPEFGGRTADVPLWLRARSVVAQAPARKDSSTALEVRTRVCG